MQMSSIMKLLSAQQRAFYCYVLLTVWLFLLLVVMYKYIETEDVTLTVLKSSVNDQTTRSFPNEFRPDIKQQRILRGCYLPQDIRTLTEDYDLQQFNMESISLKQKKWPDIKKGPFILLQSSFDIHSLYTLSPKNHTGQVMDSYQLEGVLILIRHGDRGPLTHVRDISSIDCAANEHPQFPAYETFMDNLTGTPQLSQLLGPFHGFPLLPHKSCSLGQLTHVGVSQLLATGEALKAVYADKLGLSNLTSAGDIVVYSTKYRRTVQSALAFLFAFLTPEQLHNVNLKESASLQFCFDDCACPISEGYLRKFNSEKSNHLNVHPAVLKLVNSASMIVYEVFEKNLASDPHSLRDALLTYVCHGARLPCSEDKSLASPCVHTEQVTGLLSYIEWEARQYSRSPTLRRACLLKAYGMIRNIVSHLVRIVSERKPKLVLYSGHDKSILYLATALGIATDSTYLAHYASRLVVEVYRNTNKAPETVGNTVGSDYYFRVVFNGKDMTNRVQFCKGNLNMSVGSKVTSPSVFLCPIHTFIQFLHNDYFAPFNTSNFKDACVLHSK